MILNVCREKVAIPGDKPFIFLQGESKDTTSIEWGESGSSTQSATFTLNADNFVAADLSFKVNHAEKSSVQLMFFLRT